MNKKNGLIIGKFYPLHVGHIDMIEQASKLCDTLIVEMQFMEDENYLPITIRKNIFEKELNYIKNIDIRYREYKNVDLPSTSESSLEISKLWAQVLIKSYPKVDIIFGSEQYVKYLAEFMFIPNFKIFNRSLIPISSTKIRENPYKNWEYIPNNLKKELVINFIMCGTESTFKSTLSKMLSEYFNFPLVIETARENGCENSQTCDMNQLMNNVKTQTIAIEKIKNLGVKFMVSDTCPITTKSYAKFLFNKELLIPPPHKMDIFLFCMPDAPYFQDGTRLNEEDRNRLHYQHLENYNNTENKIYFIKGNLEQRFEECVKIINIMLYNLSI